MERRPSRQRRRPAPAVSSTPAPTSSSPTRSAATATGWRCTAPSTGCSSWPRRRRRSPATVADAADRPVVVAGSVGPTGELFEPLGALTHDAAVAVVPRADRRARRRRRRRRLDRDDVGARRGARRGDGGHRGRHAVHGDLLVRHRRAHDDGTAAGRPRSTSSTGLAVAAGGLSAPTAASAPPTSWSSLLEMTAVDPTCDDDLQGQLRCPPLPGHRDRLLRHPRADGPLRRPRRRRRRAHHRRMLWHVARASRGDARGDRRPPAGARPDLATIVAEVGPLTNLPPGERAARTQPSRRGRRTHLGGSREPDIRYPVRTTATAGCLGVSFGPLPTHRSWLARRQANSSGSSALRRAM